MTSPSPTRITFVRHGHVHNPDNVIYGRLPGFELSDGGRQQAQAAAEALRAESIVAFFSSPLLRARQTMEILHQYHPDIPTHISERLIEINVSCEGLPMDEMAARDWDMYTDQPTDYDQPEDIAARTREFVRQIRRDYAGQHVVAVSHGDVIAFTVLNAMREPLRVANKRTLDRFGIPDSYPATGSLTTLIYTSEGLPRVDYRRPYNDDLLLATPS